MHCARVYGSFHELCNTATKLQFRPILFAFDICNNANVDFIQILSKIIVTQIKYSCELKIFRIKIPCKCSHFRVPSLKHEDLSGIFVGMSLEFSSRQLSFLFNFKHTQTQTHTHLKTAKVISFGKKAQPFTKANIYIVFGADLAGSHGTKRFTRTFIERSFTLFIKYGHFNLL